MKEIKDGIVMETEYIRVCNPPFLVPKLSGKIRKILDCRQVNKITNLTQFKMEGTKFIKQILTPHDYAKTFDLENVFHHVTVSDSLLPYFGFAFLVRAFAYRGHPFGYKNSLYIFNKILKIVQKEMKKRWRVKLANYIDDIILMKKDEEVQNRITIGVIQFLKDLGWRLQA
ncbi:MAG: hypothetical protein EZS28_046620, partial [Streblomastix strix]